MSDYLQALERLMVSEDQPAWASHLRWRARLRKAPKRHFVDPSLALAASGAAAERLLEAFVWFGQLRDGRWGAIEIKLGERKVD